MCIGNSPPRYTPTCRHGWVSSLRPPCDHAPVDDVDEIAALRAEVERLRVLAVHDAELYHNQNHVADFRHCGIVVCQERRAVLREIRQARALLEETERRKPKRGAN